MISAIVGRISAHYIALLIVSWFLNTTKSQPVHGNFITIYFPKKPE
jgi:hypothetical protein